MKKLLTLLLALIIVLSSLVSCESILGNLSGDNQNDGTHDEIQENKPEDKPSNESYSIYSFSEFDNELFISTVGTVIPFIPTNEYTLEQAYSKDLDCDYLIYRVLGNTESEFTKYRRALRDYDLTNSYVDDYGVTWYCYDGIKTQLEMSFFQHGNKDVIEIRIFPLNKSEGGNNNNNDNTDDNNGSGNNSTSYLYTDFTSDEKALFTSFLGLVLPFAPNNEYYVEQDDDVYYEMDYIAFYTLGNTQADFNAYRALYSGYTLTDSFQDEDNDTWYCYEKGDVYVEMAFYYYEGDYVIDVYAYNLSDDSTGGNNGGTSGGNNSGSTGTTYTDFTTSEKNLFLSIVGEVIPFVANNEYYVEEYYDDYYEANSVNFYTFGNTQADFNSYRALFSAYTLVDTYEDDYGDTWYCYEKGDVYVEMAIYYYEGVYVIDVYAYNLASGGTGGSGSTGGGTTTDGNVITNEGAGLPVGTNGIYDVDFTDADKVKDVTDQGYYIDGCPTTGSPAVLVIPVEFGDVTAQSKGLSINSIEMALTGDSDYYSLYEYYYISSGATLSLDITVVDQWFRPQYSSSYYASATIDYYGESVLGGDMLVLDEALDYLDDTMDLSRFDSDNNGIIDAIILVTTLDIGDDDFHWAYRYWNVYTDENGYYFEYDGVSANDYIWMSAEFIHESYDAEGNVNYDDKSVINPYTFIHEFGHILGLDDNYDTSGMTDGPLEGCDMMDALTGDHNPFSKFNLGWITTSKLVTGNTTISIRPFTESGDTIIIANNFDPTLGAYQEYYIICYYTNTGLNAGDNYGFFARDGILVYHVNASLYKEDYYGETYYDIYNNNTSTGEYSTPDNLIEFVKSQADTFTYIVGDTLPTVIDDQGNLLSVSFTIDSLDSESATLSFTVN